MKAVLCRQHGGPEMLTVEDVASPQPGAGDVVVAVHAAAVNFPDTLIIANKYQLKPHSRFRPEEKSLARSRPWASASRTSLPATV